MNFIVLSSSRGTTLQAVIEAMCIQPAAPLRGCGRTQGRVRLTAKCLGLVTNDAKNGCVEKARAASLPVKIVKKKKGETYDEYDQRLDVAIRELGASDNTILGALGWMFVFSPWFVRRWNIVNVHPALLPKYGGKGMYGMHVHEAVLASTETESGITIHLTDEGIDTGPILLQKRCPVFPGDTPDALRGRVQTLEKEWYPKVLQMLHEEKIVLPPKEPKNLRT